MDILSVRFTVTELFDNVVHSFSGELSDLIKKEAFIAGGCFKSLVLDEPVNDYDFWFRSKEAADKFADLISKADKTASSPLTNRDNLKIANLMAKTDHAVTLSFPKEKVQFVRTFTGSPVEVVGRFDYYHTHCYFDPVSNFLSCPTAPIIAKSLLFNEKSDSPLQSMKRMGKFIAQGWTIGDIHIERIAKAISGVNWADPVVVAKQKSGFYEEPMKITMMDEDRAFPAHAENRIQRVIREAQPQMARAVEDAHVFGVRGVQMGEDGVVRAVEVFDEEAN